jgi:hypothetical protein
VAFYSVAQETSKFLDNKYDKKKQSGYYFEKETTSNFLAGNQIQLAKSHTIDGWSKIEC